MSLPILRRSPSRAPANRRGASGLPLFGAVTLIVGLLVSLAAIAPTAGAALIGSPFNGADGLKDALAGTALPDRPTGTTDNSYTGGAKEDDQCPKVETGSIPPNKADLTNFYVATGQGLTDTFLYLAWERASTNGTVTLDFELNQSGEILSVADGCNGVNPTRTLGDRLITYDLQGNQGILTVGIEVRMWDGSKWGDPVALNSTMAEGSISPGLLFGEMVINLHAAGIFGRGECDNFASVFVKSRSSSAFPSELKDFIAPVPKRIGDCGLSLDKLVNDGDHAALEEALLVHSLDALTYSVVITNIGDIPLTITDLSDTLYSDFPASCSQDVGFVLAGGASITCTYEMPADGDRHNVASVTAVDSAQKSFSAEDGTFVDMITPAITIVKTADPKIVAPGDVVTFSYLVTNTGDTALHNVTVTDDILGVVGSVASLAPGESVTMTKTMVAAVTSPTHNVGTSVGTDVLDKQVTASEPEDISIVVPIVAAVVPAEVLGIQLTQPAVLPRTGFPVSGLSLFAAALIILGSTLRWNVNRRSKRTA